MKLSSCCGWEQTDDIFHDRCAKCHDHCSWEEICIGCDNTALLDGEEVNGEAVIFTEADEPLHIMCEDAHWERVDEAAKDRYWDAKAEQEGGRY